MLRAALGLLMNLPQGQIMMSFAKRKEDHLTTHGLLPGFVHARHLGDAEHRGIERYRASQR